MIDKTVGALEAASGQGVEEDRDTQEKLVLSPRVAHDQERTEQLGDARICSAFWRSPYDELECWGAST